MPSVLRSGFQITSGKINNFTGKRILCVRKLLLAEVEVIPRSNAPPGTSSAVSEPPYRNPEWSPIRDFGFFHNFMVPFRGNRHKKADKFAK